MAKKITGYIKLQIQAGKATPAPPVGPALGQHGVNIMEFTKQFKGMDASKDLKVKKDGGGVEAITSATITTRAVCAAINAARRQLETLLPPAAAGKANK